jgi:hypothetical protein
MQMAVVLHFLAEFIAGLLVKLARRDLQEKTDAMELMELMVLTASTE